MRQAFVAATTCLLLLAPRAASAIPPVTLADYWPHEDGRTWFYDQHAENLVLGQTTDNQARLAFAGTTVAAGGIAAQLLTGSVTSLPAARATSASDIPAEVASPFLRRLWIARPDLRTRILSAVIAAPCPQNATPGWEALLLGAGFAYVQTANEAAAWRCNLANTRAWLWLTSDLSPGSTTTIPLIPDLADDVTLKLTVLGLEDVTVPGGSFQDCLHVDYVIDYGTSMCTSPTGEFLGTYRSETRGYVRYAPGVGPVESFEEFGVAEMTGSCPDSGWPQARASLKLNSPSLPATAATWGKLKSAYRR